MIILEKFQYLKVAKNWVQFEYVHKIHCVAAGHNYKKVYYENHCL
jgi:hypothetical protein